MVRHAFLAPHLDRKVPPNDFFIKGNPPRGAHHLYHRGCLPPRRGTPAPPRWPPSWWGWRPSSWWQVALVVGGEAPLVVGSLEYFTPNMDTWALFDPEKTWFTPGQFKPKEFDWNHLDWNWDWLKSFRHKTESKFQHETSTFTLIFPVQTNDLQNTITQPGLLCFLWALE